jgi:hypothetical protein
MPPTVIANHRLEDLLRDRKLAVADEVVTLAEKTGWKVEWRDNQFEGYGSVYIELWQEETDTTFTVRVSDHYAKRGSGFNSRTGSYHNEPSTNIVVDAKGGGFDREKLMRAMEEEEVLSQTQQLERPGPTLTPQAWGEEYPASKAQIRARYAGVPVVQKNASPIPASHEPEGPVNVEGLPRGQEPSSVKREATGKITPPALPGQGKSSAPSGAQTARHLPQAARRRA